MPDKNRDDEARKLADNFMSDLIKLNNGDPISTTWKNIIQIAIESANNKAAHRKIGPKHDYEKIEHAAQLITRHLVELTAPLTKNYSPAKIKKEIAASVGYDPKRIAEYREIIEKIISVFEISEEEREQLEKTIDSLDNKQMDAVFTGIGKELVEEAFSEIDKEKKR